MTQPGDDPATTGGLPRDLPGLDDGGPDWRALPARITDRINGLEAANTLRNRVIYVPGRGRYIYDGSVWVLDVMDEAKREFGDFVDATSMMAEVGDDARLRARVDRIESAAGQAAALQFMDLELAVDPKRLDADPEKLNTAGGLVDLRATTVEEHDPAHLATHRTEVALVADRAPSLLDEFLETVQPDVAQRRYIFKVLGATLLGGNRFRHFILIHGGTSTGKSTFVELMAAALGSVMRPVNVSVFRGSLDDRPRPDLLRALDARVIYTSEASTAWDLHADMVKRMTGGDPIVARGMVSNHMVERVPSFTPVIVTNVMPRIKGADDAVKRRLVVLPFVSTIDQAAEDVDFRHRLVADQAAREQVLRLLILGCRAALQDGFGDAPEAVELASARAFEGFSHVPLFLEWLQDGEYLVADPDAAASRCVRADDLYRRYSYWVDEFGNDQDRHERLGLRQLGEVLRDAYDWRIVRSNGSRWAGLVPRTGAQP